MRTMVAATVLAACVGAVLTGCGSGSEPDDAASGAQPTTTSVAPSIEPTGELPDFLPDPGSGVLVLGRAEAVTLEVTACSIDPAAAPDGQVPAELLSLTASGTTADGVAVTLDVSRFRSLGASPTVTDTVTVVEGDPGQPDRALVAQRFEVAGQVTDLRDVDADDPLLRITGSSVEGGGVFAPPGETTGSVEGRLRVVCP